MSGLGFVRWWMQLTKQGHPLGWFFSVSGRWYAVTSGVGFGVVIWAITRWRHKNCHQKGCWRIGHHPDPFDPSFVRCSRHHIEAGHGP